MESTQRESPLLSTENEVEPVNLSELNSLPSRQIRRRLDSVSSTSTTSSTVTFRSGNRVYETRQKKKIPQVHKVIFSMFIIVGTIALGAYLLVQKSQGTGMFQITEEELQADEAYDEMEHERPVEMNTRDWVGLIAACFFIFLAAGGGIGGGGVLVPTYIILLQFPPKYAIPLSNCTILGSSISNLILNVNKRHEYADRPMMDWDIMLMMEPLTIAGALVGTFINVISPPWLVTLMLVILLVSAAHRTLGKGIKKFKKETIALEKAALEKQGHIDMDNVAKGVEKDGYEALPDEAGDPEKTRQEYVNPQTVLAWTPAEVKQWWERSLPPGCQEYIYIVDECELDGNDLLDLDYISLSQFNVKKMLIMKILRRIKQLKQSLGMPAEDATTVLIKKEDGHDADHKPQNEDLSYTVAPGQPDPRYQKAEAEGNTEYMEILKNESIHQPWKVLLMFLCTAGMLTLTILKGGGNINPLNVESCTPLYWTLTLAAIPWVLVISYIGRAHLLKTWALKDKCGYEYLPQDVVWDETATIKYPLMCSMAGLAAGMFGIGGGIVKGPLMLEMNVYPPVTSATSATMILFTSSAASVSYLLFEQLNLNYAVVLFCLGIIFTLAGQIGLNKLVKKYKRNSLIVLLIGTIVALSAVAMGIESCGSIIDLFKGEAEPGSSICEGAGGGEGRLL